MKLLYDSADNCSKQSDIDLVGLSVWNWIVGSALSLMLCLTSTSLIKGSYGKRLCLLLVLVRFFIFVVL
jgi:hypothetical protein